MCRPVKCNSCGKTTWAGCGAHVDQVMSQVKKEDQCKCHEQGQKPKDSTKNSSNKKAG